MALKTLFAAQAANGNSTAFKVRETPGNEQFEKVAFQVYGTWNSATVSIEACYDINASPQQWTVAAAPDNLEATFTQDFAWNLEFMSGTWIRATIADTASPIAHSLTVKAKGDLATS